MQYTIQNPRGALIGRKVLAARREQGTHITLECGELFRLEGDPRGQVVQVVEGRVWLTQSGDGLDVILEQGQSYRIPGRELLLMQGLPAARIRLSA